MSFYYKDTETGIWHQDSPGADCLILLDDGLENMLENALKNQEKETLFIIVKRDYPTVGIPATEILYLAYDSEFKFVSKDIVYRVSNDRTQRTCIPIDHIVNPGAIQHIKTLYPYVIDYIDNMQRDKHPYSKEEEEANYIRATNCYNGLTDDQKAYYVINGDCKYLRLD